MPSPPLTPDEGVQQLRRQFTRCGKIIARLSEKQRENARTLTESGQAQAGIQVHRDADKTWATYQNWRRAAVNEPGPGDAQLLKDTLERIGREHPSTVVVYAQPGLLLAAVAEGWAWLEGPTRSSRVETRLGNGKPIVLIPDPSIEQDEIIYQEKGENYQGRTFAVPAQWEDDLGVYPQLRSQGLSAQEALGVLADLRTDLHTGQHACTSMQRTQ